jgi:hypothetical protein
MRVSGERNKNRTSEIFITITNDEDAARYQIPKKKEPKTKPTKSVASAAEETAPLAGTSGTLVSAGAVHSPEVFDMPVDPNEPTYCLCNQVSYGEMVGCDNPDVSIQILI